MEINESESRTSHVPKDKKKRFGFTIFRRTPKKVQTSEETEAKPIKRRNVISHAEVLDGNDTGEEANRQLRIEQKMQARNRRELKRNAKLNERDEHERWRTSFYRIPASVLCAICVIGAVTAALLSCVCSGYIAEKITGSIESAMLYALILPISAAALEVAISRQSQGVQDFVESFLCTIFVGVIVTFIIAFSRTFGVEADPTDMSALLVGEDYRVIHIFQVILELIATFFFLQGAREHWETARNGRENKRWVMLNLEAQSIESEIDQIDNELIKLRSQSAAYLEQIKRAHAYAASVASMLNK